jgi:hypothetical protein
MNRTVKVYKFRKYDIASDAFVISGRMATRACIKRISAQPIKGTEMEISRADVDSDGLTEVGFRDLLTSPASIDARSANAAQD